MTIFDINWSGTFTGVTAGFVGKVVGTSGNSATYVVATTANLTAGCIPSAIVIAPPDAGGIATLQYTGVISGLITGLSAGAKSPVVADATGALVRKATPVYGTDIIVGDCTANGDLTLSWNSSRVSPPALISIAGTGFAHVTAGAVDGTARAVNLATADVTGLLPVANIAGGTNGFFLQTLAGVAAWAALTVTLPGIPAGTKGQVLSTNFAGAVAWQAPTAGMARAESDGGLVGDGVTDDSTALTNLLALIPGTYAGIQFGAKTYKLNGTFTFPAGAYVGQGRSATILLQTATTNDFIRLSSPETSFRELRLQSNVTTGSIGVGTDQVGLACGVVAGASCPDTNVEIDIAVFDFAVGMRFQNGNGSSHKGPDVRNPEVRVSPNNIANIGIDVLTQAEYVHILAPLIYPTTQGTFFGIGIQIAAGSCYVEFPRITDLNLGFQFLTGTNAGHATVVGGEINHCSAPFKGGGDFSGVRFIGTNMYGGEGYLHLGTEMHFESCSILFDAGGASQILIDGPNVTGNRFINCEFTAAPTIDVDAHAGQIWFRNCTIRDNLGTIPSTIAARTRVVFGFASGDANTTLTLQQSTAEVLVIPAGTFTAPRTIAFQQTPASQPSRRVVIENQNAFDVTIGFGTGGGGAISGTGQLVPSLSVVTIECDGTNTVSAGQAGGGSAWLNVGSQTVGGAGTADTGLLRFPYSVGARATIMQRDSVGTGNQNLLTTTGSTTLWGVVGAITQVQGDRIDLVSSATGVTVNVAGGTRINANSSGNVVLNGNTNIFADGSGGAVEGARITTTTAVAMLFAAAMTSVTFSQADLVTNSGTGAATTLRAQNETGTTSIGGTLVLSSGSGTTAHGQVQIKLGSNAAAYYTGAPGSTLSASWVDGYSAYSLGPDSSTTVGGKDVTINAQGGGGSNAGGGNMTIRSGAISATTPTTVHDGAVRLQMGSSSVMVEACSVAGGSGNAPRILALCRTAVLTSTQMPANTGDGVVYLANAQTNPTANPVSGGIMYGNAGAGTWRGTGGTTTAFGPA